MLDEQLWSSVTTLILGEAGGSAAHAACIAMHCHACLAPKPPGSCLVPQRPRLCRAAPPAPDCDGVLWRGSTLMPGTIEALAAFRARGLRLLFLTNNSSKSRRQYRAKFEALGIAVAPEEIVPTSYAAAAYLQAAGFRRRAFLIGNEGVAQELEEAGINYVTFEQLCARGDAAGATAAARARGWTPDSFAALQLDASIGAVVVGWDPCFSYAKLCYASACLRELPGCAFVATNLDAADRMPGGRMMPGTGCSVHAVETAAERCAVFGAGGACCSCLHPDTTPLAPGLPHASLLATCSRPAGKR